MSAAPSVYLKNITLSYRDKPLFNNLNLSLKEKQWTALIGASGVGKSSLLRIIAGLTTDIEAMSGDVYVDNALPLKQQIAYMAQTDLLLPWLTVLENTLLSIKLTQTFYKPENVDHATLLLAKVGLEDAIHLYPHQLSGGMRQRTALARTLLQDKPIVLMDEPFSALDAITRYKLQNLAATLLKDKTVLFVTHDPNEALRLANVVFLMEGAPAQLREVASPISAPPRSPAHPDILRFQAALFADLVGDAL